MINPALLGQELRGMQLDVDHQERKKEIIAQLKLIEGVLVIFDFHGKGIRVVFYCPNSSAMERKIKLIAYICGFEAKLHHWYTKLPAPEMRLRQMDWRILQILLKKPRMEILPIARQLGISTRTVNRRLRQMTSSFVAYLIPVREVRKSRGVISCFLITCPEELHALIENEIRARGHKVDFVYTSLTNHFLVTLLMDNLAGAEDLLLSIKNLIGVKEARLDIMKDFIFVDSWLGETVESLTSG